jgi:branched-chain amino acid transport system substrate-binding protein
MNLIWRTIAGTAVILLVLGFALPLPVGAQGAPIKIGVSVGITGYMADPDQAIRDGAMLAIEKANREGGVLGRKLELVVEDMRSEPQQAVSVVNKLIISDKVSMLLAGGVSAGNSAAAPIAARYKVPMVINSILPPAEQGDAARWCYSMLAPPGFEIVARYGYLQKKTKIKKVGFIHDTTPYITMMKNNGLNEAPKYGLTVVGVEQYKVDDTDMKAQLTKLAAAGAEAILKFGTGPSTIMVAKNMRDIGMKIPLFSSIGDMSDFWPSVDALGDRFFFVATLPQVPDVLGPNDPVRKVLVPFLATWSAKYPKRDAASGGRGYDSASLAIAGIKAAGSTDGEKLRAALENVGELVGTCGVYQFTPKAHAGVQVNPMKLVQIIGGKPVVAYDPAAEK